MNPLKVINFIIGLLICAVCFYMSFVGYTIAGSYDALNGSDFLSLWEVIYVGATAVGWMTFGVWAGISATRELNTYVKRDFLED